MYKSEKELTCKAFINREYGFRHSSYEKEFAFYDYVKNGDIKNVDRFMTPLGSYGSGTLSENPLQNLKYHFTVTIALITRFCVEGGMEMETAYTLSDLYILKADKCTSEPELHKLHRSAVLDFTEQMGKLAKEMIYSKPVIMTMDYIYDNLHSKISIEAIARNTALSTSYLSRLFHKEVGMTITAYIAAKRIETAQNMLKYSEYSPLEIGNYLSFSTHSHFISTFKRYTGMTPGEFRKKYYRSSWEL